MKCFVVAMTKEAENLYFDFKLKNSEIICEKRVLVGELFGEDVGIILCGVGKVNAAMGAQIAIDKLGADTIINIGVAGGLNDSVKIAHIYSVAAAVQYDFDLTALNHTPIGTLDECKTNFLPLCLPDGFEAKKVATADRFNDDTQDFLLLTKTLGADIRDMECGAIAQVCMHAKVKFYAFKIISDLAGSGSTPQQYYNNLKNCFETLRFSAEKILKSVK